MLTQCQHCKKTYHLSIVELKKRKNPELLCSPCEEMLGRLKRFGSSFINLNPTNKSNNIHTSFWGLGIIIGILILIGQLVFFEWHQVSQRPEIRNRLQQVCKLINIQCPLETYRQPDDFEIMHNNLQIINQDHYELQMVISNQGQFSQAYPAIKLKLINFTGEIFAQRIFLAKEYLNTNANKLIPASKTVEFSFKITLPKQKVVSYHLELI